MKGETEDPPEVFTVVVQDKTFKLSKSQIIHDEPNYFTTSFFNSVGQRTTQALEISRDPYLFEIVLRYLNGYQVIPIPPGLVPPFSTPKTVLADLREDAGFYQLDRLLHLLSLEEDLGADVSGGSRERSAALPQSHNNVEHQYAVVTGCFRTTPDHYAPVEEFDAFIPRFNIMVVSDDLFEAASREMFDMSNNELFHGKNGTRNLTVATLAERIARVVVRRDANYVGKWQFLGWKRDLTENLRHMAIFVRLWAEPGAPGIAISPTAPVAVLSEHSSQEQKTTRYVTITGYFPTMNCHYAPVEQFEAVIPRFSASLTSECRYIAASTDMVIATEKWLREASPQQLASNGWSERIARVVVARDTTGVERWDLLGWKCDLSHNLNYLVIFVKLQVGCRFSMNH